MEVQGNMQARAMSFSDDNSCRIRLLAPDRLTSGGVGMCAAGLHSVRASCLLPRWRYGDVRLAGM